MPFLQQPAIPAVRRLSCPCPYKCPLPAGNLSLRPALLPALLWFCPVLTVHSFYITPYFSFFDSNFHGTAYCLFCANYLCFHIAMRHGIQLVIQIRLKPSWNLHNSKPCPVRKPLVLQHLPKALDN